MYRELIHHQSLLSKRKSDEEKYIITEYAQRGEKGELKLSHREEVTGLSHAIERATILTNIALNGRSISVLEIKLLRENMKLDLMGWRIEVERKEYQG